MYKGSILERLNGGLTSFSFADNSEAIYQSVANNLSKIFSTNAGSASTVLDYGKPDLNNIHLSLKDSLELIEDSIELNIRKYEPRLLDIQVSIVRDDLNKNDMTLFIQGGLIVDGKTEPIRYKADLMSNGKVKVYNNEN
ncbi:type VI secretion system baseplate subunit TssE [Sulfurimonas sp. MAG313]|nr:type VI secretion system baseplate subunit TssE [Sulfurimonas sp. MAG313]MDF1880604.1 type VI secretion system baseplate subunit TssE [Sulfurimonas sp. MAG313]